MFTQFPAIFLVPKRLKLKVAEDLVAILGSQSENMYYAESPSKEEAFFLLLT